MSDCLSSLPGELLLHVLSFLPFKDLINCQLVSHKLRSFAQDNLLWRNLCTAEYGSFARKALPRSTQNPMAASQDQGMAHCHWFQQYQLNHGWDKGICHAYRFEYPGNTGILKHHLFKYEKRWAFLAETEEVTVESGKTYIRTMIRTQKVARNVPSTCFTIRTLKPGNGAEPVVLVLDSAHKNPNKIVVAVAWSDQLIKTFSFDLETEIWSRQSSHRIEEKVDPEEWCTVCLHHPFIVIPNASLPGSIFIFFVPDEGAWKCLVTLRQLGCVVAQAQWATGDDGTKLYLLETPFNPMLGRNFVIETVTIPHDFSMNDSDERINRASQVITRTTGVPEHRRGIFMCFPYIVEGLSATTVLELVGPERKEPLGSRYVLYDSESPVWTNLYKECRINPNGYMVCVAQDWWPVVAKHLHLVPPNGRPFRNDGAKALFSNEINRPKWISLTKGLRSKRPSNVGLSESKLESLKRNRIARTLTEIQTNQHGEVRQKEFDSHYLRGEMTHDDERIVMLFYEQTDDEYWIRLQVFDFWRAVTDGASGKVELQGGLNVVSAHAG